MSQDPTIRLTKAKELYDIGVIDTHEFEQIKRQCLLELGMHIESTPEIISSQTIVSPQIPTPIQESSNPLSQQNTTSIQITEGMEVGNYRIHHMLGQGGMGTVYVATHKNEMMAQKVGKVAIKLIHPKHATKPTFRDRFTQEAALGIRVNHPNIARVYELIDIPGHLGFAMQMIIGETLEQQIPNNGMTLQEVIAYLSPLADALDHLHKQNISHRDFKPDNIKITN